MIEFIFSGCIIYIAYYLLITKPVTDEMSKEKHNQDSQVAVDIAKAEAVRDDYDDLFNTEFSKN